MSYSKKIFWYCFLFHSFIFYSIPSCLLGQDRFECSERIYFFRADSTLVNDKGTLSYIEDYQYNQPRITDMCPMATQMHNSLGANPVDGYLYYTDETVINRLDSKCRNTPLCDLGFISYSGSFDWKGQYWVVDYITRNLYSYDIKNCKFLKGPFELPEVIADISYNLFDCHIYLSGNNGTLYKVDTNGQVVDYFYYNPNTPNGVYIGGPGGIANGSDNSLYAMSATFDALFSPVYFYRINKEKFDTDILITFTNNNGPTLGSRIDMATFPCIKKKLEPKIVTDLNKGCTPLRVNLSGKSASIPEPNYWRWDFGDNSPVDTLKNTNHIFWNPGKYNVRLIAGLVFECGPNYYDTTYTEIDVENNPAVLLYSAANEVCDETQLELKAYGTGPFVWNTGETSPTITITAANGSIYKVTGSSPSGTCQKSDSILITTVPRPILYPAINPSVCKGNNTILSVPDAQKVRWSDGFYGPKRQVRIDNDTSYAYTVYTSSNCFETSSIKVSVEKHEAELLPFKETYCSGNTLELKVDCEEPCYVTWRTPNLNKLTGKELKIDQVAAYDSGIYNAGVVQGNCSKEFSAQIKVIDKVYLNLTTKKLGVCENDPANFNVYPYPAGSPLSWSGPNGFNSTSENIMLNNVKGNQTGYYKVTSTIENCVNSDSLELIVYQHPDSTITLNKLIICESDTISMSVSPGNSYSWNGPGGFSSSQDNVLIPSAMLKDAGKYKVIVTDKNNCISTNEVTVSLKPQPAIFVLSQPAILICKGENFTIDFTGSASNTVINGPNGFQSSNHIHLFTNAKTDLSGLYKISASENGCLSEKDIKVTVDESPDSVIVTNKYSICEEGQGNIEISLNPSVSSGNITWYKSDNLNPVSTATVLRLNKPVQSGNYYAIVQSANKTCPPKVTNKIEAKIFEMPKAGFYSDMLTVDYREGLSVPIPLALTYAGTDKITFSGWYPSTWLDNPDTLFATIIPKPKQELIVYTFSLKTGIPGAECYKDYLFTFLNRYPVTVPNVFSPNGDGLNDTWMIKGLEGYPNSMVYIYNRWGALIYKNESGYKEFWDGKRDEDDMPVSTYYYILKLRGSVDNSDHDLSGSLTIIR